MIKMYSLVLVDLAYPDISFHSTQSGNQKRRGGNEMKSTSLVPAGLILMALLACISTSQADIVAYWSFDEGSGDAAEDGSGNGNDGTIFGAEWVDGKFGKALEFDANYVLVPNDESYNFTQDQSFSIILWINYEAQGDWQGVLQKFNGGYPFKVEVNPSNSLYCAIWDQTNNPGAQVGNVSGDWHHFAFVRDRSEKKIYSYLDGQLQETKDDTINGATENAADLYIGARKPGNTILFYGTLDEIAIYNRVLTEAEILSAVQGNIPDISLSVSPKSSLGITWGSIKVQYY
jgi:hypothetical protein